MMLAAVDVGDVIGLVAAVLVAAYLLYVLMRPGAT